MELDQLEQRLVPFVRAKYDDPDATVSDVEKGPGHAGFSYFFTVHSGDTTESWFLRLPPPNVNWVGTADVLRQVESLNALEGTAVPHCTVRWSGGEGDDLKWFECPYFIVPKLDGDVLRFDENGWARNLSEEQRHDAARQAMTALANIHRVPVEKVPYLGDAMPFDEDVTRWDRFYERAAEPQMLADVPRARQRLLDTMPQDAPIGLFHGDFQWANLFYSFDGELLAVIDWELTGVGATLNDVGWIATFNDPSAWAHKGAVAGYMPYADELLDMYREAHGEALPDLDWFRALAAYKFAIISGLNLSLHRRGKRDDPHWEDMVPSMKSLIDKALELLG